MNGAGGMNEYDRRAWEEVTRRRERRLARRVRRVIPQRVRDRAGKVGEDVARRVRDVPGAEDAERIVQSVLGGMTEGLTRVARGSLRTSSIVDAYASAGHPVRTIVDIRALDLRTIDDVKPGLDGRYIAAAGASGVTAGFVVSGGEVAALVGAVGGGAAGATVGGGVGAVPGAGVGAAPGAATVVTAMAADSAATLVASMRLIFHTAAYYGFDPNRPEERLRALGILNFATAVDQAAKNRAYLELNRLVRLIVRNAAWKHLDDSAITHIVRRVFAALTERLTKQKLGAALPLAGIAIGAGLNMRTLSRVGDAADFLYREQFLREKYNLPSVDWPEEEGDAAEDDAADSEIPLVDIIEEEVEEDRPQLPPPDENEDGPAA